MKKRSPAWIFVGLVLVGAAGYLWLQLTAVGPARRPPRDRGRPVRVMEVQPMHVVPAAIGYGVATARRSWQAVAEVGGTILEMSPNVEVGRIVREGTLLYRIDPESAELEKTRSEATVRGVRAQLSELSAREASARASLSLEQRALALAEKDLDRARRAHEAGLAPLTDVEAAERGVLNAQKAVQGLQNTLQELPASRRVLEAQLAQHQVGAEGARLGLRKAEAVAPFTMRISQLNASVHQSVSPGQVVLVGDATDVLEVVAQLPVGTTGALLGAGRRTAGRAERDAGRFDAGSRGRVRGGLRERISAVVRLKSQGVESSWDGTFRRFQGVDPATRTMGVVVAVDQPRRRRGASGPPLLPGLHVEVELRGEPRSDCLAVPRTALHGDELYVVNKQLRLERRTVDVEIEQEEYVCVASGLRAGEHVVLTDVLPAVEGMLLAPKLDMVALDALRTAVGLAAGSTEVLLDAGAPRPLGTEAAPRRSRARGEGPRP